MFGYFLLNLVSFARPDVGGLLSGHDWSPRNLDQKGKKYSLNQGYKWNYSFSFSQCIIQYMNKNFWLSCHPYTF